MLGGGLSCALEPQNSKCSTSSNLLSHSAVGFRWAAVVPYIPRSQHPKKQVVCLTVIPPAFSLPHSLRPLSALLQIIFTPAYDKATTVVDKSLEGETRCCDGLRRARQR